jgi:hypothetical protein
MVDEVVAIEVVHQSVALDMVVVVLVRNRLYQIMANEMVRAMVVVVVVVA